MRLEKNVTHLPPDVHLAAQLAVRAREIGFTQTKLLEGAKELSLFG